MRDYWGQSKQQKQLSWYGHIRMEVQRDLQQDTNPYNVIC